jgi:succinoglycan biosynthesis transport protein ExoP
MARVPATRPTLNHFFQIIWRRRYVFMTTLVVCCLLGGVYYYTARRLYRATALVSVNGNSRDSEAGPSTTFLRAQSEHITSHAILALAMSNPEIKHSQTLLHQANRLEALRDHVSTDIARADGAISVSFDTPYPDEAALIANGIVNAYKQYQTQPGRTSDSDVVAVYQQQIEKLQQQLETTTFKMQTFEQQYGALTTADDANSLPARRLATLSQELATAQYDSLKAQSDYDEACKALPKDTTQPAGLSTPVVVSADQEEKLRMEMIDLESRRQAMQQRFLPGHPALLGIARQIESVNRDYAVAVQGRMLLAQKREHELQAAFDVQQKQVIELSAKTAEYNRLKDDATRSRNSIDNLQARMAAIQDTRISQSANVEITDPATADTVVVSYPRPFSTALVALAAGLLLGCGVASVRDRLDDRMVSVESIRNVMGIPVLGAVPQMPWVISLSVAAQKVSLDPASDVAASYRAIRAALDATAPRNRCRTILITSPEASDGKTTSAANLAIAMAQSGKRVLLVDGSLATPMLHQIFGVSPNSGLSTILGGQTEIADKAIRRTPVNGLWVLPGGIVPPNPTELINDPAFPELLEQLAEKYDHVLIDAPPLAELADARIMAASCDLSLLVLRADTATRRRSIAARDALVSVGAHVLGLILTRAPRELQQDSNSQSDHRVKSSGRPHEDEEDIIDIGASPT